MKIKVQKNLITQVLLERTLIRKSLRWVDIKITEFVTKCGMDSGYIESNRGKVEFGEILGILKFLYVTKIISVEQYNKLVDHLKKSMETEESDNGRNV